MGIRELAVELREKYPRKNIWLYTGSLWEEIQNDPLMPLLDVVVDGEFVVEEKDNTLRWKGSKNQRVIDVQKTLQDPEGKVWLHCPEYDREIKNKEDVMPCGCGE